MPDFIATKPTYFLSKLWSPGEVYHGTSDEKIQTGKSLEENEVPRHFVPAGDYRASETPKDAIDDTRKMTLLEAGKGKPRSR